MLPAGEDDGKVVPGHGVVGVQLDRPAERLLGLVELPAPGQHDPESVVRLAGVGRQAHRPAGVNFGLGTVPTLAE